MQSTEARLADYQQKFDELARANGLDYYPVDFQSVPTSFMTEIAVYGLPVRMAHWSFGVRYMYQLVQHQMGNSRVFEVVFPGNPGRAFLAKNNALHENALVSAHVLGHADFSKNNALFKRSQDQVGYRIVEQAAEHSRQIDAAIETHGIDRVEPVLDAALALEQHIDVHRGIDRNPYPEYAEEPRAHDDTFRRRFDGLLSEEERRDAGDTGRQRLPLPPQSEKDLLWFIAKYAPAMEDWERDIFLAVRRESFYFYPVFACQIMNEGWASYWHARLLREADFLPHDQYLDAAKTHSDVVRPHAGDKQIALSINPYHLGFTLWEKIIDAHGVDYARRVMEEDDDFSFIRNYLTEDLARELRLFNFNAKKEGEIKVASFDIDAVRENILAPKFNFGAAAVLARHVGVDGSLDLEHKYQSVGRGLDLNRARKVLAYIHQVWRRPVRLHTIDSKGAETSLEYPHSD